MKVTIRQTKRLANLLVAVVLVAGMCVLNGCGKQESSQKTQEQKPEVVVIGGVYPLTGPMAALVNRLKSDLKMVSDTPM
ncbi:MAG: hypothetical protein WC299_06230 [Kiritimatiellia bacterium]